jgi:endonuclease/exonuclease/phosphatase family metal-dependent hydrolase
LALLVARGFQHALGVGAVEPRLSRAGDRVVRVLTWNIWNGGEGRNDAIQRVLREQDADVVALQEANDRGLVEGLAAALDMELVYGEANGPFAVAWLSRSQVERAQNHRLPVLEKTLLEIEVAGLRLFATHLSAGRSKADEPRRIAETEAILEVGRSADMLVGDFNAVHPDDEIGDPPPEEQLEHVSRRPVELVLDAGFTDCYRSLHDEAGWTYLSWHPWARIDFVFGRRSAQACEVVETDASDHFPVVADFA